MYYKGFDKSGFITYMENTFGGFEYPFLRETISNIIDYGHKHNHISKDQFCDWITEMVPEVEFGEVAMFMEDDCLTERGREAKNTWLNKSNISSL